MEQNNHKFRLRLNLFDAIILVAVLLVGAAAAWIGLRSGGETTPTAAPVRYTVMFQKMREGESALIQPGDQLEDAVKNYQMGNVVAVEARPAEVQVLDQERQVYVNAVLEGYEDVYVTVESTWAPPAATAARCCWAAGMTSGWASWPMSGDRATWAAACDGDRKGG